VRIERIVFSSAFLFPSSKSDLKLSLDGFFVGDVDTVEELADILVLDENALLDLRGGLGDQLEVVTLHGDLVLLSRLDAFDAVGHRHATNVFLAEEVTHFHRLPVVLNGDVDGEMGVDALHLVTVTVGDALHHVFDMTDDGSHGGDIFAATEPFFNLNPLSAEHLDVQLGVFEGLAKHSTLPLDGDDAVIHRRPDVRGDFHLQARVNGLHFLKFFFYSFRP